jgi:2-polyprenyl-6-methoxyphenol hydroxylase-like FAD-dependent oxidoreductase
MITAADGGPLSVVLKGRGFLQLTAMLRLLLPADFQRVAATFRTGRVLLAGDSAHVNNPVGGMGMNGGIRGAINLAGKLARMLHGEAETLLDLYSRQRCHAAVEYVQAQCDDALASTRRATIK